MPAIVFPMKNSFEQILRRLERYHEFVGFSLHQEIDIGCGGILFVL